MIDQSIRDFFKQFDYEPVVENEKRLKKYKRFVVIGMGGSNLTASLLNLANPELDITIHRNYDLPNMPEKDLKKSLIILSSYSGNTEEVLDAYQKAGEKKLKAAVVATGGALLEAAKKDGIPYIQMPNTGIQPRMALGFSIRALMKLMRDSENLQATHKLMIDVTSCENAGKQLAENLNGRVPVIYASEKNEALAHISKIIFNETGKIPAFYNVFPELSHNEMTGFDVIDSTKPLSEKFYFLFIKDSEDDQRIIKRLDLTKKMYSDRGLKGEEIHIQGKSIWEAIFHFILIVEWAAYYISQQYGTEPEQVPMVEEFKKLMKK